MDLKGTKTEKNLQTALNGESVARNKYTFFEDIAKQEQHPEVAELFAKMTRNEHIHAKLLYQALNGEFGDSSANLKDAMSGEYFEWTSMYPQFAKEAEEEGFTEIAELFKKIAAIEKDHEHQFLQALAALTMKKKGSEAAAPAPKAKKTKKVSAYRCMFCGAVYEQRPDVCDVCGAIGSFEDTVIEKSID